MSSSCLPSPHWFEQTKMDQSHHLQCIPKVLQPGHTESEISLGSINKENNGALTKAISALLAEFDVPANRIYVNFFDLERQNVGYNGATFAG
mmetsp:Transcript_10547/g.12758  ORF Transcript_10547/g.12758 Transcript_10547/m.12758 type:complete len:92 (-) Transcript_10547:13-288(-)